jgi:hypothetical protein
VHHRLRIPAYSTSLRISKDILKNSLHVTARIPRPRAQWFSSISLLGDAYTFFNLDPAFLASLIARNAQQNTVYGVRNVPLMHCAIECLNCAKWRLVDGTSSAANILSRGSVVKV